MSNDKLRRQIAYEAARMMCARQESEYSRARLKAARRICRGWVRPDDLPTYQEIREQIQSLARLQNGESPPPPFDPLPVAGVASQSPESVDRFAVYRRLLAPLETVRQNSETHPEGDALYDSLQVFELAREARSYDEELLLAALLHDVGKAIDPRNHVAAALESLRGAITERTAWFIENHSAAAALREGTLGVRARRRLEASEDFEDLMLLHECDVRGRRKGVQVPDVPEALEHLRELSGENGAS